MPILFFAAFLVLLLSVFIGRIISERAFKSLDASQKVLLMDSFSKYRSFNLLPIILIFGVSLGVAFLFPENPGVPLALSFGLIVLFMIRSHIFIFRKLATLQLPRPCVKLFVFARSVSYIGLAIFLAIFLQDLL